MYLKVNVTCELCVVLALCQVWFLGDNPIWFYSLCDNRSKSKSVPFHFGWHILPCYPWGEEVPWLCVGKAAAHGAKRPHAKEVLFDAFSLLAMGGETQPWGYGWGCYPWGQKTTYQRGQYYGSCEWVDPLLVYVIVWYICDKLPYVRFYDFGIILLVLTDYGI